MEAILDMLYKQVAVAAEDHWDARVTAENNNSLANLNRLEETYAELLETCRIRDEYIMKNVL